MLIQPWRATRNARSHAVKAHRHGGEGEIFAWYRLEHAERLHLRLGERFWQRVDLRGWDARRFKQRHFLPNAERYEELATDGQTPETMIISCSDSRVDPETIFGARPG